MSWYRALVCDSCNFKRKNVNEQTTKEANEHEQGEVDHWVQLVEIEDGPSRATRRKAK